MYPTVPTSFPSCVGDDSVGSPLAAPSTATSFASPKSSTFTRPSVVTNKFSGFRSRCTIPFPCAASSPRAACSINSSASRSPRARRRSRSRSVSPARSSVTTYGTRLPAVASAVPGASAWYVPTS